MVGRKIINGFPDYIVDTDGSVCGKRFGKPLKASLGKSGYTQVVLCGNKNHTYKSVHRLVLETFVGPCPDGMECCHNNGIKDDNKLENLRWDTKSNNQKDSIKHGTSVCLRLGEQSINHKLTEQNVKMIIYMYRTGEFTQQEIAHTYNVSQKQISNIVNRKDWKHIWGW